MAEAGLPIFGAAVGVTGLVIGFAALALGGHDALPAIMAGNTVVAKPDAQTMLQEMNKARILPVPDAPLVRSNNYRPSLDGFDDDPEQGVRTYRQPTALPVDGSRIYDPRLAPSRRLPPTYIATPPAPPERVRSQSL